MKFKWKDVSPEVKQASAQALSDAAEFLLEKSNETVPFDIGTLQGSGKTSLDPASMTAAVSYDTPYAVRLHEHPEYNFQNGRRGKWLELTIQEQKSKVQDYIADRIRQAMRG